MRARIAVAALAAILPLLAACSSGSAEPTADRSPDSSDVQAVGWSPCDDLSAETAAALVGEPVKQQTGTTSQPRCTFTPVTRGGAAYDVSYLWFDGGLDAALDAMGATGAQLRKVDVPGAESARVAINATKAGVLVTGFVQTRGLVQSVNAAQVAPYDKGAVVSGVQQLLGALAQRAPTPSQR